MKTFKIVALQVIDNQQKINIPLSDGLVINKENNREEWIVEAYISKDYAQVFEKMKNENAFEIRVIITHHENDPAPFNVHIYSIKYLKEHISVLFEGTLIERRKDFSELLLSDLMKEGFTGDELLKEFKRRLKEKDSKAQLP